MRYFFPPSSLFSSLFPLFFTPLFFFTRQHPFLLSSLSSSHFSTIVPILFFSSSASHLTSPPVAVRRDSPLTFKESDPREPWPFTFLIISPLVRFRPSVKDRDATLAPLMCNPSHTAVRYEGRSLREDSARATCRFDLFVLTWRGIAESRQYFITHVDACCPYRPLTTKQVTRKMRRMMPPAMDTARMVDWFGSPMAKTSVWGK